MTDKLQHTEFEKLLLARIETDRLHHCAVVDALEYQIEQRDEAFEKMRKELNDFRMAQARGESGGRS